jgi:hypothetical protein
LYHIEVLAMPLDDLVTVIETLQGRIEKHGASLRENETRTRMALIDPLLQTLGWDTADPGLVTPEYNVSGKRADYALLDGKRSPMVFLEAKRLDELLSNHRSQVAAYASELGIKYPALTNGNDWEVYDNSKLVPIEQRSILNLSIKDSDAHQTALQLLLLWRPNLASGEPVAASDPLLASGGHTTPVTANSAPSPEPTIPDGEGWIPLNDYQPGAASQPPRVRLPDGTEKQLKFWYQVLVEISEWLIRTGRLKADDCPIRNNGKVSIVNTQPKHESGNLFFHPYTLSNGLFLNKHGNKETMFKYAMFLLEPYRQDPAAILLKLN